MSCCDSVLDDDDRRLNVWIAGVSSQQEITYFSVGASLRKELKEI